MARDLLRRQADAAAQLGDARLEGGAAAQRLAALEKHRHHDAVEQVLAQVASGDEIRVEQRMLDERAIDDLALHVDRQDPVDTT